MVVARLSVIMGVQDMACLLPQRNATSRKSQLFGLLTAAAKEGVYNLTSPLHAKSIVAKDLNLFYAEGDEEAGCKTLEAARSEETTRKLIR